MLLKELTTRGSDIHRVSSGSRTPLMDLLAEVTKSVIEPGEDPLQVALKIWLEELRESGINLETYGRQEAELHKRDLVRWDFEGSETLPDGARKEVRWTVKSFIFGSHPRDWYIRICKQADLPTREPEQIVQSREVIPGGWVEEAWAGADVEVSVVRLS